MDPPRLRARYQPSTRTLEFDLSEAPFVDAIESVCVLSTNRVPSAAAVDTSEPQKGLFYGKDTFLFEQPFVFDCDATQLTCWVCLRVCCDTALHNLAAKMLGRCPPETVSETQGCPRRKECVIFFSGVAPHVPDDAEYVYFSSAPLSSHRCTEPLASGRCAWPSRSAIHQERSHLDSTFVLLSAIALSFDL